MLDLQESKLQGTSVRLNIDELRVPVVQSRDKSQGGEIEPSSIGRSKNVRHVSSVGNVNVRASHAAPVREILLDKRIKSRGNNQLLNDIRVAARLCLEPGHKKNGEQHTPDGLKEDSNRASPTA